MDPQWEDLPTELLKYQLSFLDVKSLVAMSLVSKAWYTRTCDEDIWQALATSDWYAPFHGKDEAMDVKNNAKYKGAAILGWREVYGYLAKTRANSRRMCYQKHRWYHDDDNAYTLSIDQERLDNATDAEFPNGPPGWDRSAVRDLTVDRKHVISAGGSTVRVWDVNTTNLLYEFRSEGNNNDLGSLVSDGKLVVAGYIDEPIKQHAHVIVGDLERGELLHTFTAHRGSVFSTILRAPLLITSGSVDMSIRFWDLHTGQQTREITGLSHYTDKLQMHSSDPNIFFSGHNYFDKILVWDIREKNTHVGTVNCGNSLLRWGNWENTFVTATENQNDETFLNVMDMRQPSILRTRSLGTAECVSHLAFDSNFISVDVESTLRIYSLETLEVLQLLQLEEDDRATFCAMVPGNLVVYGTPDGGLYIAPIDPRRGEHDTQAETKCLRQPRKRTASAFGLDDCCALTVGGDCIASSWRDGEILIYNFAP